MSSSVQHFAESSQVHERRTNSRIPPKSLIYVACGESNGGMVLNVSDNGLAISMAIAVGDEAYSHLNVRMNGLPESIEVFGRMVWTTKSKKRAGIQLVDVSDTQREQLREWIALEGVRDVNLQPRVAADAVNPRVFVEPRSTLLDAFGGTAPETLGPPLPELVASQPETTPALPLPSQGFDDVRTAAFRENEWDLASVTIVPRKKPKPEGLSAVGLMLLWIAIPSFGIGILVGRRPLEQWLSRGDAVGKSFSRANASQSASSVAPENSQSGHQADVKFSQDIPPDLPIHKESFESDLLSPKPAEIYRSGGSSSAVVDAKLLNSVSTQEARAFKSVGSTNAPMSTTTSKSKADIAPKSSAAPQIAQSKSAPVQPSAAPSYNSQVFSNLSIRTPEGKTPAAVESKSEAPTAPGITEKSYDHVAKTLSVDSGVSVAATKKPMTNNAPPVFSGVASANGAAPDAAFTQRQIASATAPTTLPNSNGNTAPGLAAKDTPPALSASNSAPPSVTPAAPLNPSVAPRLVAPDRAPTLAPVTVQPPLRGVMKIARNTDQAFLLKLPAESVPSGQSTSLRMQRSVMVPRQSRWHHHGSIAKLTVGELLTQPPPEKPDAKIQPRPGDTVTVSAFVDKDGAVRELKPVSGRFALMSRVMRTVREWQFDQTLVDGKPVESEISVTVEYRAVD